MSDNEFKKDDKVEWRSHATTVRGTVEEKITSDTESAGRTGPRRAAVQGAQRQDGRGRGAQARCITSRKVMRVN